MLLQELSVSEFFDNLLLFILLQRLGDVALFRTCLHQLPLPELLVQSSVWLKQRPAIQRLAWDVPIDEVEERFSLILARLLIAALPLALENALWGYVFLLFCQCNLMLG